MAKTGPEFGIPLEDSRKENLRIIANKVVWEYLNQSVTELGTWIKEERGRRVVGPVEHRPEDLEIEIDGVGERILEEIIKLYKFPIYVHSEHNDFGGINPQIRGAFDPYDNSGQYELGWDTPGYTVLTLFDAEDNEPIAGGTGVPGIIQKKVYISSGGRNYQYDLETGQARETFPKQITSILDPNFVPATYKEEGQYTDAFDHYFARFKREQKGRRWYPGGGSHIYPLMAAGVFDAYVMIDEPRSEIDPGLAFAKTAGLEIWHAKHGGKFMRYKFEPDKFRENVDVLVATTNPQLREQIIDCYRNPLGPRTIFPLPPVPPIHGGA